jgi:hypothetical protein
MPSCRMLHCGYCKSVNKASAIIMHRICIPRVSDVALFLAVFLAEELVSDVAEGGLNPAAGGLGVCICN